MTAHNSQEDVGLRVYQAWINTWLSVSEGEERASPTFSIDKLANLFKKENVDRLLLRPDGLKEVVQSFQHHFRKGSLALGGKLAPTCAETNLLSGAYNPQTDCSCNGLFPVPANINIEQFFSQSRCKSIGNLLDVMEVVISRQGHKWNSGSIFSADKLAKAVEEIILCNNNVQPTPTTCQGALPATRLVLAPSRRPDPRSDTPMDAYNELYPTVEQVKLCADAKYFFAIACGASMVDKGLLHAIADSGNDILIGDYCEAADETTLSRLQLVGAGANRLSQALQPRRISNGLAIQQSHHWNHSISGLGALSGSRP
jgi:hypothetical protein